MPSHRECLFCGENIDWAHGNAKYCSIRCKNKHWYQKNKEYKRKLYLEKKKQWERSPIGKRAGLSIEVWINLPKDFRS